MRPARPPAIALMAAAAACWGTSAATSKLALGGLSVVDLVLVEILTGAVVLVPLAMRGRGGLTLRPGWLLLGAIEPGASFLLFDLGLARTTAAAAALLVGTETLFAVGLAWALLGERLTGVLATAVAMGVSGTVLLSAGGSRGSGSVAGDLLVLLAAATAAGYAVLSRRSPPRGAWLAATAAQMLGGLCVAAPAFLVGLLAGDSQLTSADASHLLLGVLTGVLASGLPFALFNAAIPRLTAIRSALILALIPVFGAVAGIALTADGLAAAQILGGAMVVLGAGAATLRDPQGTT